MAKASVREQWKRYLEQGPIQRVSSAGLPSAVSPRPAFTGIVLGIDPSLRGTGWAVIQVETGARLQLCGSGTVCLKPAVPFTDCLARIFDAVDEALHLHRPAHVACEETIYVQNLRTAQILGAARGAALAAAARSGAEVFEYAPRRIKQAVVGVGSASKEQVARTVRGLLRLDRTLPLDESDAAAAAICHAFTWRK